MSKWHHYFGIYERHIDKLRAITGSYPLHTVGTVSTAHSTVPTAHSGVPTARNTVPTVLHFLHAALWHHYFGIYERHIDKLQAVTGPFVHSVALLYLPYQNCTECAQHCTNSADCI